MTVSKVSMCQSFNHQANHRHIDKGFTRRGRAALKMNDLATARAHFVSALQLQLELMDLLDVINSLSGLAAAAWAGGAFEHATKLLGAIAAVSDDHQISMSAFNARPSRLRCLEYIKSSNSLAHAKERLSRM